MCERERERVFVASSTGEMREEGDVRGMRCRESREVKDAEACDEKGESEGMRKRGNEFSLCAYPMCVCCSFLLLRFSPSLIRPFFAILLSLLPHSFTSFPPSADVLS